MTLCKRLIARLDIKGSRLIKGVRFEGVRVLGDPCEAALLYAQDGADEILYIDAVASLYGRNGLSELLRQTTREIFIPITAGGGVRCVEDAASLLAAGADKVAVNTAALKRPSLIRDLAVAFGKQCVVVSIQARRTGKGSWEAMAEAGRERSGRDALEWIELIQNLGAGEILLTSVDKDGTCTGPDEDLNIAAAERCNVPLVLGGGFSRVEQIRHALRKEAVSAVCIGSALHKRMLDMANAKKELKTGNNDIPLRPELPKSGWVKEIEQKPLTGISIGVIDYGMGNQQSLINSLEKLGSLVTLGNTVDQLKDSNILALPGVGSFPMGMEELRKRGMDRFVINWARADKPLIGICLGMQMLFETSEEFKKTKGLELIEGNVISLPTRNSTGEKLILPHIGWNSLIDSGLNTWSFKNNYQYFVHSYTASNVAHENIIFKSCYGGSLFIAGVKKQNVVGVQFHPERSGEAGLRLLASICTALMGEKNGNVD